MNADSLPLVSIVTPTYNQAEYLAETIDSVLAQDYPNIEYLVLDDGSPDNTPEVLSRYDGRIQWERHVNIGQAATLNKGWQRLHGKYLAYISSDDRLLPHAISKLVETLEANPEVVCAYCDFDFIDATGANVGKVQSPDWDLRRVVEDLICPPGPGALFRRSAFERVGGWNPQLRRIPDFEFWLRIASLGPFLRIPQVLAESRLHAESTGIRPIPFERSMEFVTTMDAYWAGQNTPSARYSLSRAHYKSARSHAQSGRVFTALKHFLIACRYRPKTFVSVSSWRGLISAFLMRVFNGSGRITARLR